MNKREKILVAASVLAVIWGIIMNLGGRKHIKGPGLHQAEDINVFISSVSEKVKDDKANPLNGYILSQASGDWGRNPFLVKSISGKSTGSDYVYTGYVQSGKNMLALINNLEYRTGERIEGTGFEVMSITPRRVILLENKKKKRVLPLEGSL